MQSVWGQVRHPKKSSAYINTHDGKSVVLPGTGGITYNVKIGDSVYAMQADHVEPGVSLSNEQGANENSALQILSCIGNEAKVTTGEAKGARGFVTGTHGGINHLLVYFPADVLEKLEPDDKVLIKAQGQGARILEFPEVHLINLSPALFDKLGLKNEKGKLVAPVAARVPAYLMGSGLGSTAYSGDYDIQTSDWKTVKKLGLDKLRYGDIVLLEDCDATYGRSYRKGAVTVGVVVHSDSMLGGHGPGVTVILSAKTPLIQGVLDSGANLADYFHV
jgi:hypothetical protein